MDKETTHKTVVYKEYYPKFLISPRWLSILFETVLTLTGIFVLIILLTLLTENEDFWDMVFFSLLIIIPIILLAVFYKVRIYSDGTLSIFLCGKKRNIAIYDIKKIYPVPIKTRLYNLTYYNCLLTNGKIVTINIEDIDNFVKELKLYNDAIEYTPHYHL